MYAIRPIFERTKEYKWPFDFMRRTILATFK